uniref:Pentatricopeptide repeat-containing protein n=1 Tax=Kalanchoe fedtschenkoi TaxID=63787 RepID=A0A7N0UWE6_KALFE
MRVVGNLTQRLPSWAAALIPPIISAEHLPALLSLCGRHGFLHLGSSLHASLLKKAHLHSRQNLNNVVLLWNSLLAMYSKCGVLGDATTLFDEMPSKDTISWNTIISGFFCCRGLEFGFHLFKDMHRLAKGAYTFDQATLTTILSACDERHHYCVAEMVHCLVVSNGYEKVIPVGNALITSYFKCQLYCSGTKVFEEMFHRNVVTWTALISGLAQAMLYKDSLNMFVNMTRGSVCPNLLTYLALLLACSGLNALTEGCQVHGLVLKLGHDSDVCLESSLMDMYCKCGNMEDAWRIFESADKIDDVSVTVILVGFAQNGFEEEAIRMFVKILKAGTDMDPNMISAVLGVFGYDTTLAFGTQIHSLAIKKSFSSNVFVCNGLINMYSKCGNLVEAYQVFSQMNVRNSVSWNSIIAAYARHGNVARAFELYDRMRSDNVLPTDVTFLSLLHGCSHAGLVEKGMAFLESMCLVYHLRPRIEHYACIVDMLGRACLLEEARHFVEGLPEQPGIIVWQALLGACSFHGEYELGKYAAKQLNWASPKTAAPYVLMANIYSSEGKWKERAGEIRKMKEMRVKKETGISWIELEKEVHSFVVADKMHPQSSSIYEVVAYLFSAMIDEGYIPDKSFIRSQLKQDGYATNED